MPHVLRGGAGRHKGARRTGVARPRRPRPGQVLRWVGVAALVGLGGCGRQSTLSPESPQTHQISLLWWWMLAAATIVFAGAVALLALSWRRRGAPGLPLFGEREDLTQAMVLLFGIGITVAGGPVRGRQHLRDRGHTGAEPPEHGDDDRRDRPPIVVGDPVPRQPGSDGERDPHTGRHPSERGGEHGRPLSTASGCRDSPARSTRSRAGRPDPARGDAGGRLPRPVRGVLRLSAREHGGCTSSRSRPPYRFTTHTGSATSGWASPRARRIQPTASTGRSSPRVRPRTTSSGAMSPSGRCWAMCA